MIERNRSELFYLEAVLFKSKDFIGLFFALFLQLTQSHGKILPNID
ncbi:hypothetical protein [Candidatus Endomicrobiellum pyrsonymphae]